MNEVEEIQNRMAAHTGLTDGLFISVCRDIKAICAPGNQGRLYLVTRQDGRTILFGSVLGCPILEYHF